MRKSCHSWCRIQYISHENLQNFTANRLLLPLGSEADNSIRTNLLDKTEVRNAKRNKIFFSLNSLKTTLNRCVAQPLCLTTRRILAFFVSEVFKMCFFKEALLLSRLHCSKHTNQEVHFLGYKRCNEIL